MQLRDEFGDEYFDATTRELLRKKLREIVFSDERKRQRLNTIMRPAIRWEMIKQLIGHAMLCESRTALKTIQKCFAVHRVVFLDAPLLFEVGLNRICHVTLVISS